MKWLVIAVAAAASLGAATQRWCEARDRRRFPAPGRLVRVGDVELHVVSTGSGPTVLIDSGLGGSSIEWSKVAAALESDFTVVRYDRPGFAWSPGVRCDRRALAAANRLIDLLRVLDLPGPAILVGHSLGGLHVRAAAAMAPQLVAGLVLVDPSHEEMLDLVESSREAAVSRAVLRMVAWSAPFGMGRLAGRAFSRLALAERRQPPDEAAADGARLSELLTSRTVHGLRALAAEHGALVESLHQVKELVGSSPPLDLPLTVITAAAPATTPRAATARAQIDALHAKLVAASPRGRHVLAHRSGHLVPLDEPELVAQCVRESGQVLA